MSSIRNNPAHWLQRAQETRQLAEGIDDGEAKRTLLNIAEEYERLAARATSRGTDSADGPHRPSETKKPRAPPGA